MTTEEAIKLIEHMSIAFIPTDQYGDYDDPQPYEEALSMAIDTLKQNAWISVSERLPEEHEWIGTKQFGTTISDKVHITFDVNGKRFVRVMSLQNGELSDSDKKTMDVFYKGWKMLAWMPMPEPYRESGEA